MLQKCSQRQPQEGDWRRQTLNLKYTSGNSLVWTVSGLLKYADQWPCEISSERKMGVDETICLVCGGSTFVGETISCETCLHWWATSSQAPCNPVIPSRYHFNCVGVTHTDDCVVKEDVPYFCPRFSNTNLIQIEIAPTQQYFVFSPSCNEQERRAKKAKKQQQLQQQTNQAASAAAGKSPRQPSSSSQPLQNQVFWPKLVICIIQVFPIRSLGANWRWVEEAPRRKQWGKT